MKKIIVLLLTLLFCAGCVFIMKVGRGDINVNDPDTVKTRDIVTDISPTIPIP